MAWLQTQWHVVVVWRLTSFLCCACRGSLPCRTAWQRRARPARASAGWPLAPAPPPQTAPPPAPRPCTPAQRTRTAVLTNASCLMTETYPDSAADSAAHPSTPAPQADDSCQVLQRRKLQSQAPCGGCDDSDVDTKHHCQHDGVRIGEWDYSRSELQICLGGFVSSWKRTSWKFLTEASFTRPWKLRQWHRRSALEYRQLNVRGIGKVGVLTARCKRFRCTCQKQEQKTPG